MGYQDYDSLAFLEHVLGTKKSFILGKNHAPLFKYL